MQALLHPPSISIPRGLGLLHHLLPYTHPTTALSDVTLKGRVGSSHARSAAAAACTVLYIETISHPASQPRVCLHTTIGGKCYLLRNNNIDVKMFTSQDQRASNIESMYYYNKVQYSFRAVFTM